MATLHSLADHWRTEAARLERFGAVPQAQTCRTLADELEAALAEQADEALTLSEAAAESGYSERRLREMLSDGTLPQAGRKGSPRIRRRDLPRKAGATAPASYDPSADAAHLLTRMAS